MKRQRFSRRNARQQRLHMTRIVHLHRHDMSTVLFNCPVTSMTSALSNWCSNRAGDNQSHPEFCYSFDRPQNRFQTRLSFVTAQRFRSIIKAKKNRFLQNKCTVALINVNCWWYILLINFAFFQHLVDFSLSIFGRVLVKLKNSNSLIKWSMPLYQIFKLTHWQQLAWLSCK